jgi:hypothetical protein
MDHRLGTGIHPGWRRSAARRAVTIFAGLLTTTGALANPATAATAATPARLKDQRACAVVLTRAQEQERTGSLLEARDLFLSCARAPCTDFLRRQCAGRYAKLQADTPTIVFVVTDASGAPRNDVQVRIDGTLLEGPMDGHPVEVDPGFHGFSFIADGHVFATQKIMIVQGQRNRFVTEVMRAAGDRAPIADAQPSLSEAPVPPLRAPISTTTPVRTARRPVATGRRPAATRAQNDVDPVETEADTAKIGTAPGTAPGTATGTTGINAGDDRPAPAPGPQGVYRVMPWVLGGVALGGAGAGALLTVWGRRDNDQLASCAPTCSADTLRHIRRLYTGADVAFGVGLAALGAAYWFYAVGQANPTVPEAAGSDTALRLDVNPAPTGSGGVASVSGRF